MGCVVPGEKKTTVRIVNTYVSEEITTSIFTVHVQEESGSYWTTLLLKMGTEISSETSENIYQTKSCFKNASLYQRCWKRPISLLRSSKRQHTVH